MKIFYSVLCLSMMFLLMSCRSRNYLPEEVLQLPKNASVYTAYNIWYDNPSAINPENMQRGKMIPFGTPVTLREITDSEIVFSVKDRVYRMDYDESRILIPVDKFVKTVFTTVTASESAGGVSPVVYEKMRRGVIQKGMTKKQVLLTFGPPLPTRTPSLDHDTWIYWIDRVKSKRVVFDHDKVIEEFVLE